MSRTRQEDNSINRVLKAWGMPSLDSPGVVEAMARMVDDHDHFTKLLKACDPELRRDMYESMAPHLRFRARPLEDYIIQAKAEAARLPVIEPDGHLHFQVMPEVRTIEIPEFELWAQCHRCQREVWFYGERKVDAIDAMRREGWGWDELGETEHLCPECLEELSRGPDVKSGCC